MNNQFINQAKSISLSDIELFEKEINGTFPEDFKKHYLQYNGGFPMKDRFCMSEYNAYISIDGFIPIKYHYENNDNWTMEETYSHFNKNGYLYDNFIAFASDRGGNKVCLDLESDKIFMVYMDLGNPTENPDAIREIANDFQSFISNLEEDEEEDV